MIPKIEIDWELYIQWYLQTYNKNTLGYALNYARKYADVLADPSSVHRITSLSKAKKRLTMIALAEEKAEERFRENSESPGFVLVEVLSLIVDQDGYYFLRDIKNVMRERFEGERSFKNDNSMMVLGIAVGRKNEKSNFCSYSDFASS